MTEPKDKPAGFQQVDQPKSDLAQENEPLTPDERRRRRLELAKTFEGPPPSAALKPGRKGVDPLASTGVHESVPPAPSSSRKGSK